MANINKSFNFRNGVQVDNDNFVVNPNGLVGIGTSIPREFLDVYGTAKVTGLVTTTNLAVTGVSTFYNDVKVGSGITISSSTGAVRATTFYGSAAGLTGIYAIAVGGWYVNVGNISTTSNVGIGTTLPYYSLQVGQDPLTGNGFSVDGLTGNVKTTGIITANSFNGSGASLTLLNATNIASGTLDNARLSQNINVSGIATAYSFSGFGTNLQGINASNINNGTLDNARLSQNISITGIISATSGIITSLTTTNINNTGIATFGIVAASQLYVSGVTTSANGFVGTLTGNVVGIASTALSLSGTPSITVANVTSSNINNTGIITSVSIKGQSIESTNSIIARQIIASGITTLTSNLFVSGNVGFGTSVPNSNFHLRKSGSSSVQITSDTNESYITIGSSILRNQNNGEIRFGNNSGSYSNSNTLDIVNYSTGNINQYLNNATSGTGNFNWINSPSEDVLMTLRNSGSLGIGITLPLNTLHVVGTSTVTSTSYVGNSFYVRNNARVYGSLQANSLILDTSFNSNVTGNVYAAAGVSTFSNVNINNNLSVSSNIAVGKPTANRSLEVGSTLYAGGSFVGIFTDAQFDTINLNAIGAKAIVATVGVGTTAPKAAVDFTYAGKDDPYYSNNQRFMIPPKVSTIERNLNVPVEGGLVYNTTTKRLELYIDSTIGWVGIATLAAV